MSICKSDYFPAFFAQPVCILKKPPVEIRALPETKQASQPPLSLPKSLKEESPLLQHLSDIPITHCCNTITRVKGYIGKIESHDGE